MTVLEQIKKLGKSLYPTGRVFKMRKNGVFDTLNTALAQSEARAYADAVSILNSAIPDNVNFTAGDATAWERRLGIASNSAVALEDRKLAIQRKMNHPGTIKARQNYRYLQDQLAKAGFTNLYVYENRFPDGGGGYITKTPTEFSLIPYPFDSPQYSDGLQYGDAEYGGSFGNKVVNSVDQAIDDLFDIGDDFRSTFFVGGDPAGSWADVDENREIELRQLILKIKPVQTVAFLLINYI